MVGVIPVKKNMMTVHAAVIAVALQIHSRHIMNVAKIFVQNVIRLSAKIAVKVVVVICRGFGMSGAYSINCRDCLKSDKDKTMIRIRKNREYMMEYPHIKPYVFYYLCPECFDKVKEKLE